MRGRSPDDVVLRVSNATDLGVVKGDHAHSHSMSETSETGRKVTDHPCPKCHKDSLDGYWKGGWMEDFYIYCTIPTCDYEDEV